MRAVAGMTISLLKLRIGVAIAASALAGVAATSGPRLAWWQIAGLTLAVLGASGAAGAFNHYYERDLDKLMRRTCNRPFASGALKASVTIDVDDKASGDTIKVTLGTDGKIDARVKDDTSLMLSLMLDVAGSMQGTDVTGNATLDTAVIKKDAYLRISRLTLPEEMQPVMDQIQSYMNTWYIFKDAVTQAEDAVAGRHREGAARQEIPLDIDDQQCVVSLERNLVERILHDIGLGIPASTPTETCAALQR